MTVSKSDKRRKQEVPGQPIDLFISMNNQVLFSESDAENGRAQGARPGEGRDWGPWRVIRTGLGHGVPCASLF